LEKAVDLKTQLEARADILGRLGKQPDWVIYGAAILEIFGSNTIMHPVDTINTRLQVSMYVESIAAKDKKNVIGDGGEALAMTLDSVTSTETTTDNVSMNLNQLKQ